MKAVYCCNCGRMRDEVQMRTLVLFSLALATIALTLSGAETFAQPVPCAACVHGAPGPIIGAGLPMLVIGFGVYWFARRFIRKPE
jgi:hypothetical protein